LLSYLEKLDGLVIDQPPSHTYQDFISELTDPMRLELRYLIDENGIYPSFRVALIAIARGKEKIGHGTTRVEESYCSTTRESKYVYYKNDLVSTFTNLRWLTLGKNLYKILNESPDTLTFGEEVAHIKGCPSGYSLTQHVPEYLFRDRESYRDGFEPFFDYKIPFPKTLPNTPYFSPRETIQCISKALGIVAKTQQNNIIPILEETEKELVQWEAEQNSSPDTPAP
jgi:hypothetical protein